MRWIETKSTIGINVDIVVIKKIGSFEMGKIIQTAGRNALGDFAPDFAHTDLYESV